MATTKQDILKKIQTRKIVGLEILSRFDVDDPKPAGLIPLIAAQTEHAKLISALNR